MVDLTTVRGTNVKAIALMLSQIFQYIGASADCLGFQRLQRPVPTHLITDNTVDVVFQRQHIDHGEVTAGAPLILKTVPVFKSGKPGLYLLRPGNIGQDGQGPRSPIVILEQYPAGACFHHAHAVGAGAHHTADASKCALGRSGICSSAVGPYPDLIPSINPGHESIIITGGNGSGFRIGTIVSRKLDVDTSD